jgi:transcriptional regulator with XRE-family HTH domain
MKSGFQSCAGDEHFAGKRSPSAADNHVSHRIRARRIEMGLSQEDLGRQLGLSFQQIQKYECAISRISVGRLYELARALDCSLQYFFDGLGAAKQAEAVDGRAKQFRESCRQRLLPWGFDARRA